MSLTPVAQERQAEVVVVGWSFVVCPEPRCGWMDSAVRRMSAASFHLNVKRPTPPAWLPMEMHVCACCARVAGLGGGGEELSIKPRAG